MVSWFLIFGPIFGPALLIFAVYVAAKRQGPCPQRVYVNDARPYDARKITRR